jgi:hypothetical protein
MVLVSLLGSLQCNAQNLDSLEVITRFFEANGGEANWRAVKSIHKETTYTEYKNGIVDKVKGIEWIVRGENHKGVNFSNSTEGFDIVICLNDSIYWRQSKYGFREILPEDHAKYFKATMGFSHFQYFMQPFVDISFLGTATILDTSYYSFRVKFKDFLSKIIYYIDKETFLITFIGGNSLTKGLTKYSDYRQVESIYYPYLAETFDDIESVPKSIGVVHSIEINTINNNSMFRFAK